MRAFLLACLLSSAVTASTLGATDPLATLRPGHPRLLLTDDALAQALAAARTDPLRARLHEQIIAAAETQLKDRPLTHTLIGPRMLDESRRALSHILTGAMAYRLSGDKRFADRAKLEMLTAAGFADWNPSHFLDVAELSAALGLGYDWLYSELSPAERLQIETALVDKGLSFATLAYNPVGQRDSRLSFPRQPHNWNQVCNGGLLLAALALAETHPDLARIVIAGAHESLPLATAAYEPDGAYPEGPGYWDYGTGYNVLALAGLESALGSDFGLGTFPGLHRTARYRLYIKGPTELAFNYADGGAKLGAMAEFTWLAQRFGPPAALEVSRNELAAALSGPRPSIRSDRFLALHAIWFPTPPTAPTGQTLAALPLNAVFHGPAELALLRSAWGNPNALWVGFKAGSNSVNHAHLDLGSFVLESDGIRWAEDLGPDNYNLPEYFNSKSGGTRWTYFRLNNHSHNTLTPGDALQSTTARAPIQSFVDRENHAYAIADLGTVYPGLITRWHRGVALWEKSHVLVQDELEGIHPNTPLTWQMASHATVQIIDPHHARLTQKNRVLEALILAPADVQFTTRAATPKTSAENQNAGVNFLEIRVSAGSPAVKIVVLFTPRGAQWPADAAPPTIVPLADWK